MLVQWAFAKTPGTLGIITGMCKFGLKPAGLHGFFGWFCVVLFEGNSLLKECLKFDGLSWLEPSLLARTIGQHSALTHELCQDWLVIYLINI